MGFWAGRLLRHAVVVGLPLEVVATNMIVFSLLLLAIAAVRPIEGLPLSGCLDRSRPHSLR